MDLLTLVERIGEAPAAALLGLLTGVIFGVAAQRSRFCLRAATVEFARGQMGDKVAVWLLTFSTAVIWVQGAQMLGLFRAIRVLPIFNKKGPEPAVPTLSFCGKP